MNKKLLIPLAIIILLGNGCISQTRHPAMENLGLVRVIGFDLEPSGKMKATLAFPRMKLDEIQIHSAVVDITQEAIWSASMHSNNVVSFSHLSVVLFSEAFARERGLKKVLMDLYRNGRVSDNVFLAIVADSAEEAITTNYPRKPVSSQYIFELLRPMGDHKFNPFTTIHGFIFNLTDEVSDPVVPYLDQSDQHLGLTKFALFKDDKMIDVTTTQDAILLEGLRKEKDLPGIKFETDEKDADGNPIYASLEFVQSKLKITNNKDINNPKFVVEMSLAGRLLSYTGDRNTENTKERLELEKLASTHVTDNLSQLLSKFQSLEIDPIGMGETLRIYHRDWSKAEWNKTLSNAEIQIKVNTNITTAGPLK
ncbi:Ger(x)C family spore germination protein [Alkaliphilus transvaalensis]|uniref:Ger(x)C family spore germination protein n=1 Tax=Alkaliphilus transvaalensis TaxID=114628 RepID=UPI00047ED909|nr:Ger(x)C family spore germination protein [Alkaliphilus transvaalensis]